jgi:hypothetical protein
MDGSLSESKLASVMLLHGKKAFNIMVSMKLKAYLLPSRASIFLLISIGMPTDAHPHNL